MTGLYTSPTTKKTLFYDTSKLEATKPEIKIQIAQEISEHCTKPLLISLYQMNKHISSIIITDIISKGLK